MFMKNGVIKTETEGLIERLKKPVKEGAFKWLLLFVLLSIGILLMQGTKESDNREDTTYLKQLRNTEKMVAELCESVKGAGKTKVALSFSESVYVSNTDINQSIGGIGIVCEGGDDPEVVHRLISLVSAAYGVPANKIYITQSKIE